MKEKNPFTVDDAYALKTPADSVQLYGKWAATYDADFVASTGYIAYQLVAEQLIRDREMFEGPVLDIGCGTGAVGACLGEGGIDIVDGVDISVPMLEEAGKKRTTAGKPVYRNLISADLTGKLDIPDDTYSALISAGTFTHGHLGPDTLDELWRIAAPGARCVIAVRTTHFDAEKFDVKLQAGVVEGSITEPKLRMVAMYSEEADNAEHADDKAYIVSCQISG